MKNTNYSVKNLQTYLVLFLAVLVCGTLHAEVNSYLGAQANVGEWTLLPSESKYGPSFGVAGGVGFIYEMQAGGKYSPTRFLFDVGAGVHGGMTSFMQGSNATATLTGQKDVQGDPFEYVYEIANRHDQYTNLAAQIPIMIGFQHRKFYALAGVKIDANLLTRSHSSATLNTYGKYDEFNDFRDMPEYQFFTDRAISGSVPTTLRLNMNASIEIGGRLGLVTDAVGYDVPKRTTEMRIGAFVDYGLVDVHTAREQLALGAVNPSDPNGAPIALDQLNYNQGSTYPVYNTTSMVDNLVMNDIMSTSGFASAVKNLMVGVKFTILFQMPKSGKCVICRDAYGSSFRSGSGGRGVKYEE